MISMILAGGRVGELSVLTLRRPKSALPFAGYFRIIDFPLSNLMRAGIHNVGILSQYRPASLIDHVGVGESWDFVGLGRGAKILPPFRGAEASDWYRGNADAVFQNLNYVRDHQADLLLILSGDHIYSMDYRSLIQFHLERGADMTVAVKEMDPNERFGWAVLGEDGRMLEYEEKPTTPKSNLASLTIYLVNVGPLTQVLREISGRQMVEFGRDVLPAMLERYRVYGWLYDGYWAYTRTIESYYQAHQDLLSSRIDIDQWGIRSNLQDAMIAGQVPAQVGSGATIEKSFLSSGCLVEGTVRDSVLSPNVMVERGAVVSGSILFHRCVVRAGARVEHAIVDKGCEIGPDARVGVSAGGSTSGGPPITLIGKESRIEKGIEVAAGVTIQPDEVISTDRKEPSS